MNLHVLQRATTKVALVGLLGAAAVAHASGLGPEVTVPPSVYVVGWMGVVTLIVIRWMARLGKAAPRAPHSELARLLAELEDLRGVVERLDQRVDGVSERTARIEGELRAPVVLQDGKAT